MVCSCVQYVCACCVVDIKHHDKQPNVLKGYIYEGFWCVKRLNEDEYSISALEKKNPQIIGITFYITS